MNGLRPLLRLGRKEAARHKIRTALVGLLIGVPVMVLACGLVVFHSFEPGGEAQATRELGQATGVIDTEQYSSQATVMEVPPDARTVVIGDAFVLRKTNRSGRLEQLAVEVGDVSSPMLDGRYAVLEGRLPTAAGEVALAPDVAERAGVDVGDTWRPDVPDVPLRVVGLAGLARCGGCGAVVFLQDGSLPAPFERELPERWRVQNSGSRTYYQTDRGVPSDVRLLLAEDDSTPEAVFAGYGLSAFALVWTGLVAACGLSVGARRRRRELGLLAANGADPAGLRLAVVGEGLVVGTVASLIGAVVGVGLAAIAMPTLRTLSHTWGLVVDVPWAPVILSPLVGVVAAVGAALAAARGIRTSSVTDLLAGRSGPVRAAPAWFAAGALLIAAGLGIVAAVDLSVGGDQARQLVVGVGVMLCAVGLIAVSVGGIRLLARLRGPGTATRLAARDLARHGVRSAAAVAAVALTAAGWAAIATQLHDGGSDNYGGIAPDRTVVTVGQYSDTALFLVDGEVVERPANPARLRTAAAAMRDAGMRVRRMPVVGSIVVGLPPDDLARCGAACSPPDASWRAPVALVDGMFDLFDPADAAALRRGELLAPVSPQVDPTMPVDVPLDARTGEALPVTPMTGPSRYLSASAFATRDTAGRLGLLEGTRTETVVGDVERLSDGAARELGRALGDGLWDTVDLRLWNARTTEAWIGWAAMGGGTLLTLIVLALALALQRVESRGDELVLVHAGAPPSLRRRMAAVRAGLLAAIAVVPGIAVGAVMPSVATGDLARFPVLQLFAAVIALPAVAAVVFGVCTRPGRVRTAG